MRRFFFVLAIAFSCSVMRAQTYYAGTPIYDTLVNTSHWINQGATGCVMVDLVFYPFYISHPIGTQVYLKITGTTLSPNCLREATYGYLSVGDSFLVSGTQTTDFQLYDTCASGSLSYILVREGTPTTANDSFYCKQQLLPSLTQTIDGCGTSTQYYIYCLTNNPECAVNGPQIVEQSESDDSFILLFPDPANDVLTIKLNRISENNFQLRVINVLGETVIEKQEVFQSGGLEKLLDVSSLNNGLYFVCIRSGENVLVKRIAIQH